MLDKEMILNNYCCFAEHPYEEKMNKTDYRSVLQY